MSTLNSISNLALELQTTRLLRAGRDNLVALQGQIASGKKTSDLSTLGATQTRTLLTARSGITRSENYILAIKTVETRLKVQGSVLNNLQTVTNDIGGLISNAQTYEGGVTAGASSQIANAMRQVEMLLNQRVEDRQIFAGNRYSQEPVKNLITDLPVPPTEAYPFSAVTSPSVPSYDTSLTTQIDATSIAFAANGGAGTGTLTLGSSTWADEGYQVGDTITVTGSTTNNTTYTITNLANGVATVSQAVTTEAADTSFVLQRNRTIDGAGAYDEDGVYIDDNLLVPYGISSDDPAFQQLVLGLRWAYAATQDQANYTTYMARAEALLGDARGDMRVIEAETAANSGLFESTRKTHQLTIVQFQNQAGDVIDADIEEAATKLSILAAQLEASYAATGRVVTLSIVNYL